MSDYKPLISSEDYPLSEVRKSWLREIYYKWFGRVMMTKNIEIPHYSRRYGMPRIINGSDFESIEDYIPEDLAKVLSKVDYTKNPNRLAYSTIFRAILLFRKTSEFKVRVFVRRSYIKVKIYCKDFSLTKRLTL
jgi:hypothetical protein